MTQPPALCKDFPPEGISKDDWKAPTALKHKGTLCDCAFPWVGRGVIATCLTALVRAINHRH